MKAGHELAWSQVIMAANTPMLLKASMVDGRADLGLMTSGQVVGLIEDLPSVEELITRIIKQAGEVLERLAAPVSEPVRADR
jgi:NAD(P)H-dependent flavin oxidoreductase YrpB (nitropropane dioxygenase family)